MPSLEDLADALAASIGGADTETAAAVILGHFKIVRAEALREAADRCDALHPAALAVHCAMVIRALIDGAPSVPLADVTRALDDSTQRQIERLEWMREALSRAECKRQGIDPDDIIADGGHLAWYLVGYEAARKEMPDPHDPLPTAGCGPATT